MEQRELVHDRERTTGLSTVPSHVREIGPGINGAGQYLAAEKQSNRGRTDFQHRGLAAGRAGRRNARRAASAVIRKQCSSPREPRMTTGKLAPAWRSSLSFWGHGVHGLDQRLDDAAGGGRRAGPPGRRRRRLGGRAARHDDRAARHDAHARRPDEHGPGEDCRLDRAVAAPPPQLRGVSGDDEGLTGRAQVGGRLLTRDPGAHGFENRANLLNPSPLLVEQYGDAAIDAGVKVSGAVGAGDRAVRAPDGRRGEDLRRDVRRGVRRPRLSPPADRRGEGGLHHLLRDRARGGPTSRAPCSSPSRRFSRRRSSCIDSSSATRPRRRRTGSADAVRDRGASLLPLIGSAPDKALFDAAAAAPGELDGADGARPRRGGSCRIVRAGR